MFGVACHYGKFSLELWYGRKWKLLFDIFNGNLSVVYLWTKEPSQQIYKACSPHPRQPQRCAPPSGFTEDRVPAFRYMIST